jgi:RNA polymerase sigma factor (TIGR02999 family)
MTFGNAQNGDPLSLSRENVTRLCLDAARQDRDAVDQLVDHVYATLRRMANKHMAAERGGHTLTPTALVHEAYIRLVDQNQVDWQDRAHFYCIAARVMRRVLIDHARKRLAEKRGGGQVFMTLDSRVSVPVATPEAVIELDSALDRLDALSTRQRQVVEMRFFGGMTHEEVASVLDVSVPTVRRDWRLAQAWLKREMAG